MIWQLLQVNHLHGTPLILAGNFWKGLVDWARAEMLRSDTALVSPEDMNIPIIVPDGPGIIEVIRKHYAEWKKRQS